MKLLQNIKVMYGAIVVLLLIVIGLGTYTILNLNQDEKETKEERIPFTILPTLNHAQFEAKLKSGEEFYVYIGRPDCGDSRRFEQTFRDIFVDFDNQGNVYNVKYNLDEKNFYYFDISEIIDSTSSYEKRVEYQQLYDFYYTPSLVHYKNGEVVTIAEWDPIYDFAITDYLNWFYETNLIVPNNSVNHPGVSDHIIE